ncbi:MAG TPA: indole-3-glycerol phosphate synthase TrpC [Gemmatimonadales bacterium]|nr:indole-3-glycerol phosphate synthase TrpC [Gemmatimonadales bacterium]
MNAEAQEGTLARILEEASRRVAGLRPYAVALERKAAAVREPPDFVAALSGTDVAVIAEVKRRSPSAGALVPGGNAVRLARAYAEAGAAAISVLTEEKFFGGTLKDLSDVSSQVGLPVLRKDFVIDPVQAYEARAAGAAALLLIARILSFERLDELASLARGIGLVPLIEVHNEEELRLALRCAPAVVGINSRDLDSLRVDPAVVTALLPQVPRGVVAVAESGIGNRSDVEHFAAHGADAVLVGTSVAGAADPSEAVRSLVGVSRRAGARS